MTLRVFGNVVRKRSDRPPDLSLLTFKVFPALEISFPETTEKFPVWFLREFHPKSYIFRRAEKGLIVKLTPESSIFPVFSLPNREFQPEKGSHQTASSAIIFWQHIEITQ